MPNILFLDTETGGLVESEHSLISIAAIITDTRFLEIDRVEYFIRQDKYVVTPEAMKKNKIDLRLSDDWPTPDQVKTDFLDFLKLPASILSGTKNSRGRWLLHGKKPSFDVRFLKAFFGEDVYKSMFMYYERDITDTYIELADIGVYPHLEKMSLEDMCVALGVTSDSDQFHGAMYDTEMTLSCMQIMTRKKAEVKKVLDHYKASRAAKATTSGR